MNFVRSMRKRSYIMITSWESRNGIPCRMCLFFLPALVHFGNLLGNWYKKANFLTLHFHGVFGFTRAQE